VVSNPIKRDTLMLIFVRFCCEIMVRWLYMNLGAVEVFSNKPATLSVVWAQLKTNNALTGKLMHRLYRRTRMTIDHIQQHQRSAIGRAVAAVSVEQGGYPEAKTGGIQRSV
jgi:hypothetical protein